VDHPAEARLWEQSEVAQRRIRDRVLHTGMAARLHLGKTADIVNDPRLLERYVAPFEDPGRAAQYLAALPQA
jgi:hypothetical protein